MNHKEITDVLIVAAVIGALYFVYKETQSIGNSASAVASAAGNAASNIVNAPFNAMGNVIKAGSDALDNLNENLSDAAADAYGYITGN